MFVRLALEDDVPQILEMSRAGIEETCPGEPFSVERVRRVIRNYFDRAQPTIFVCEQNRVAVGFMFSYMCEYIYRDGIFTTQRVLYVRPEYRGTRASTLLLKELIRWSASIGADAIDGGNDNAFQSERTRKLLSHYGFEFVGYSMRRKLDGQEGSGRGRRSGSGTR